MSFFTKCILLIPVLSLSAFCRIFAQVSFTNANSNLLVTDIHSGCPTAVVDVNGDGLDDIVRLDQAHMLYIDYQRPGLPFSHVFIGDFGGGPAWAWGMCVADVDHNGYKDVVAGGAGPAVKIYKLNYNGTGGTLYNLPASNFFVQNINFADINEDGWEDIFACDDNAENHIWLNNGNGNFTESDIIDFDVTNTDDSGNYGSVFTDFDNDHDMDLYIAKCRQAVNDPDDGRRIDVLFVNDGNNNFTSSAAAYGLADSAQTWTANFADIDNDGDLDVLQTDYDVPASLLENDGTGHMTNITAGSGFSLNIIPIQSVMEDFDNDGFVDILVTGSDYQFFHNNGDKTFTEVPGIFGSDNMESFAIGDLNHDGKTDVYASYAYIYTSPSGTDDVYWMNTTANNHHFITLNLIGTSSNAGALGARAIIYGPWGKQIREVHAGESYGTCNTANLHFGTGSAASIDSIVVNWPSGATTTILNPAVDQFITIRENECTTPDLTISNSGGTILCPGESVVLTASSVPAGYTYFWSTGATTQSVEVSASNDYNVKISSSENDCYTTSKTISIIQNPAEIPVITASGELIFCEGSSVLLSASEAAAYTWSTGETSQSIEVSVSGIYYVTTPGTCQSWTSESIEVTALSSPTAVADDVYLSEPGTATLTATGESVSWYTEPSGGLPLSTGNIFVTPVLEDTTVYYTENATAYGADTLFTGQTYHEGNLFSSSSSTNSAVIFNVAESCILKSVKVYTDSPGERLIEWKKSNGTLIQSIMVDIPMDSSRITLDFNLVPGNNYQLSTNKNQNNILLGTDGPRLQRSDEGVDYPYALNGLVMLTGSPNGNELYYYFYDWEIVKLPDLCLSERLPVTVFVDQLTNIETATTGAMKVFPNPASGMITISSDAGWADSAHLRLTDVSGNLVLSDFIEHAGSGKSLFLDVSRVAKGIYFLEVKTHAQIMQHKVIVQ